MRALVYVYHSTLLFFILKRHSLHKIFSSHSNDSPHFHVSMSCDSMYMSVYLYEKGKKICSIYFSNFNFSSFSAHFNFLQFWAAYVPCEAQYKDAVQISLEQIDVIQRLTDRYSPQLTKCTSAYGKNLLIKHSQFHSWNCNEKLIFYPLDKLNFRLNFICVNLKSLKECRKIYIRFSILNYTLLETKNGTLLQLIMATCLC